MSQKTYKSFEYSDVVSVLASEISFDSSRAARCASVISILCRKQCLLTRSTVSGTIFAGTLISLNFFCRVANGRGGAYLNLRQSLLNLLIVRIDHLN